MSAGDAPTPSLKDREYLSRRLPCMQMSQGYQFELCHLSLGDLSLCDLTRLHRVCPFRTAKELPCAICGGSRRFNSNGLRSHTEAKHPRQAAAINAATVAQFPAQFRCVAPPRS